MTMFEALLITNLTIGVICMAILRGLPRKYLFWNKQVPDIWQVPMLPYKVMNNFGKTVLVIFYSSGASLIILLIYGALNENKII
nr:hypothetical protein [uncultured bacterium]